MLRTLCMASNNHYNVLQSCIDRTLMHVLEFSCSIPLYMFGQVCNVLTQVSTMSIDTDCSIYQELIPMVTMV